jgi:hypothetical protein
MARHLLQRLDGGNGVGVFDSRNVAAQQSGTLFDVSLRKLLLFGQFAQAVPDNHGALPWGRSLHRLAIYY